MRLATSLSYDRAVASFHTQQQRIYEGQKQISSGIKISDPHQDPQAAVNIDRLQSLQSRVDSFQRNIGAVNERLSLEDTAMSDVSNVYQRMRELTIQAGNTAMPKASRLALAAEMREGLHSIAALANSVNSQGNYAFSGADGDQKPVEAQTAGGMVMAQLTGDNTGRFMEIAEGRSLEIGTNIASDFLRVDSANALRTRPALTNTGAAQAMSAFVSDPAAVTGQDFRVVFDSVNTYDILATDGSVLLADQEYKPGEPIHFEGVTTLVDGVPALGDEFGVEQGSSKDAFTALNQMISVLRSGTDAQVSAMVDMTLTDINSLQEKLSVTQVETGAKLNTLDRQEDANADLNLYLKKSLSTIRDTDFASAIAKLQHEMTLFDAAQASFAKIQKSSLFDHI